MGEELTITRELMLSLAVALACGLLIGVEREQKKIDNSTHAVAGVRTFALISLGAAVASLIGMPVLIAGSAFVALAALLSYARSKDTDPGLTTEVAMFLAYVLGALAMRAPALAAALSVLVALLLAMKSHLHVFTREVLSAQELRDGLLLFASALIVLPILPDRAIDGWGVLNPHKVWRVVVLVMAINALGYVAQRMLGPRLGLPLSGFAGGFVSSTATIGSMGQRLRAHPEQVLSCVMAAALSNVATIVQLALILAAVSPSLLAHLGAPLVAAGLATLLTSALSGIHAWREPHSDVPGLKGRPFEPRHAILFAGLVTAILFLSAGLARAFGDWGVLGAAAAAGFADVHAAAASVAQVFSTNRLSIAHAELGLLLGFVTNTLSKAIVAYVTGGKVFLWRLLPSLLAMLAAFASVLFFWPG